MTNEQRDICEKFLQAQYTGVEYEELLDIAFDFISDSINVDSTSEARDTIQAMLCVIDGSIQR